MSKPYIHAQSSAKKFGGTPEEYMKYHEWFDQTKSHFPDQRHRAILHSSFGIYLLAQVFGDVFTNSAGKKVSVRDIGEQHVLEDFGHKFIPTIQDYLVDMPLAPWMSNGRGSPPSHVQIVKQIAEKHKVVKDDNGEAVDLISDKPKIEEPVTYNGHSFMVDGNLGGGVDRHVPGFRGDFPGYLKD